MNIFADSRLQSESPMIRYPLMLVAALAATVMFGAQRANAASVPDNIAAAIADGNRPDADKQRDADRKPGETLAFTGVKSGALIAEL
jgi:predicted methyltransferase